MKTITTIEVAFLLLTLLFFSIFSYKKHSLDTEGILIANIIGLIVFLLGGAINFVFIVFFFVIAEISTRFARQKEPTSHERRTTGNILGNSGSAVLALLFNSEIAFFGAVSAALSDTLSSELGLLSKRKPVLITSLEKVEPGTDGGVTLLGFGAALFGALLIGLLHFYLNRNALVFVILIVAGFIGSTADSFFGAIFERKKMLNNAEVNLLGSMIGAIVAFLLFSMI